MKNTICLSEKYSTTRMVIKSTPSVIANAMLQLNKFEDKFETLLFLPEGGLRIQGYFKKSFKDKPLITIITVVFNGKKYLEETIQSVINQTYDNVEYIIIDGGSTDGTLDIIKKYEDRIDYWVSERDKGIYDAMNKGIDLASGKWLNFMNAGDRFYSNYIISKIFSTNMKPKVSLIYGNTDIGHKILKYKNNISLVDMAQGMMLCHQSAFYIKNNIRYNVSYNICSDQDFTIQYLLSKNNEILYLNETISKYDLNGISSQNLNKIILEKFKINKSYGLPYFPIATSYIISLLVMVRKYIRGY